MNRTALAVAALTIAACTEDLGPITKTWSDTLATLQGQLSEVTRSATELKARAQLATTSADDAEGTNLKTTLDAASKALDSGLDAANTALTSGSTAVTESLTKGKVAGVQTAIDKVKADVGQTLEKLRADLKKTEEALGALGKHLEARAAKAKEAVAAAAVEAPPAVDASKAGEADYDALDFKEGSDELALDKVSTKASLEALVSLLNSCKDIVVEVEGHTSKVGDAKKNKELSAKRAQSVTRHLINVGKVSPSKVKKTYGYGSEKPAMEEPEPGSDAEKAMDAAKLSLVRARNERIHLRILKPCPAGP